MQRGSWQTDSFLGDPSASQTSRNTSRGSLGQLIERSTSAPPPSSTMPPNTNSSKYGGESLVGNDLLAYVTKGYGDMAVSSSLGDTMSRDERVSNEMNLESVIGDRSGRKADLQTDFMMPGGAMMNGGILTRPVSASGGDALYNDFLSNNRMGIERSQSAAPSSLGPPPGLTSLRSAQSESFSSFGIRRSASAGVVTFGGAVRPAAKTLMDLIQEDMPPEASPATDNTSTSAYEHSSGRQSSSPVISFSRNQSSPVTPSSLQLQLLQEQQQRQQSQYNQNDGATHQYQHQHFYHNPVALDSQQRPLLVMNSIDFRPDTLSAQTNIYTHHQNSAPPILQGTQQLHQPQQQIFFGSQQGLQQQTFQAQNIQQQGMPAHLLQPQGLQAQLLPNGQTVYVQTNPTQKQTYGGGYTTVHFQNIHQQQPQIIHQTIPGGPAQREQFVSVVPVQGGNQQMAYWQHNGVSQQQNINPASGIVSVPDGSSVTLSTISGPGVTEPSIGSHNAGRQRDKGGRGRHGNSGRVRGVDAKGPSPLPNPILEEFRGLKSRDWTIRRIETHIVEFCQDQNGSRFIQQRLEMGDVSEQMIVMQEVLPAIRRLRNDVFGNYVVQKLLDFGTAKMKADIRDTLEGEMLQLSLQMYGCRVVQKALEALDEDDLPRLLREFHHNVLSCIHDQNGNHVIQKCIEVLNSRSKKAAELGDTHRATFLCEQIDFIVNDVLFNTTTLSCHPYGCRVLQRILEHCGADKKTAILDEIKKCHKKLLDDQYGNYVIQHVLQFGREEDRDSILQIIVEFGLLGLSRQKFASNVVEKLLKYGNANQRRGVVREMLKTADDPSMPSEPGDGHATVVLLMVRDAYANYVVQTTLDVVPESEEKQNLLAELNAHSEELRNYTFAKHIVAKLASLNAS